MLALILQRKRYADAHGLEIQVMDIRGNDGPAARDFAAHEFGIDLLALRDELHLFGDHAAPREMHLRIIVPVPIHAGLALLDPGVSDCHGIPPRAKRN